MGLERLDSLQVKQLLLKQLKRSNYAFFQAKLFLFGATFLSVSATFWKNNAYFLLEMLPAQFCKGNKERENLRNMVFGNYYLILSHRQQVSDIHLFYLTWIIHLLKLYSSRNAHWLCLLYKFKYIFWEDFWKP